MKIVRLVLLFTFISLLIFVSCSKKEEQKPEAPPEIDSISIKNIDPVAFADSILGKKILIAYYDDTLKSINGIFIEPIYGIGFFVLNPFDRMNAIVFKSNLLDGIQDGSETDIINLDGKEKLIYHNSGSAFIGTDNYEVYQYLFSPKDTMIYSSYTSMDERGIVEMIYSKNLKDKSKAFIVNFFNSKIQKDFLDDLPERKVKIKYE